ncbi:MAG: putative DNA-binding domain-containing protein [Pseudomonadota bacterium]
MSQTAFTSALLTPDAPVPPGVVDPTGRISQKRFNVYRNNVASSLTEALVTGFPVIHKLVGDAFFRAMAGVFLRAHPPQSPVLSGYGEALPAFLESFPPVAHLPYLADVARLELALRSSYHAADHTALAPETFASIPPEALMETRFPVAPALILLRATHAAYDIWRANMVADAPKPGSKAQDIAVTRPGFDPAPHLLPAGAFAFLSALQAGETFGAALAAAQAEAPDFDLTPTLSLAFAEQVFSEDAPC